ncbi:hypothetical protein, partial [Burkholderia cenocepacia]|uniref:hypothetical protein n=1 Tax=Burkholderia cenocepacia TaxID=95486 RepID=UPI0038CC1873
MTASPCITQVPVPPAPAADDECGPAYSLEVPADGDGYAFSVDESGVVDGEGVVVVTATLDDGRTWSDGGSDPRVWRLPVTDEDCDIVGGLASPTFHEICGPDGEHPYELPMDGDHHRYAVTDPGTYVDGERVVVVTVELDEGWAAPDASTLTWTHTFSDAPCDSPAALAAIVVTPATCAAPGTVTPGAVTNATWDPVEMPSPDGPMPSAAGPDAPATLADDDVELGPAVPVRSLDGTG